MALWIERQHVNRKVPSSIPSQGTCLVCWFDPQLGCARGNHTLMFLSLSPSLPLSLRIMDKVFFKKGRNNDGIRTLSIGEPEQTIGDTRGVGEQSCGVQVEFGLAGSLLSLSSCSPAERQAHDPGQTLVWLAALHTGVGRRRSHPETASHIQWLRWMTC